jgi:hypothetical protein
MDKSGPRTLTNTFDCDWSAHFNPAKKRGEVKWAGVTSALVAPQQDGQAK